MKKIIYITDYIEGSPKIASARYTDIIQLLAQKYDVCVVYDGSINSKETKYVRNAISFYSNGNYQEKSLTKDRSKNRIFIVKNKIKNLIKSTNIYKIYKGKKYNEVIFNKKNKNFYENIEKYIIENEINLILVTVPSIFGLYIIDEIKNKFSNINIITEVRDILSDNILGDIPKKAMINAEKNLIQLSNEIICLSEGIYRNYITKNPQGNLSIIKNGFSMEIFKECNFKSIRSSDIIILSHIGSIYGGRNIKDLILGLDLFCKKNNKKCILRLIGNMDSIAIVDINNAKSQIDSNNLIIEDLGVISHNEAIKYLKETNIALVITHKLGSDYAIPGKVFEHIGACVPTLAVTEDKELVEFLDGKFGLAAKHNPCDISKKLNKLIDSTYDFIDRNEFSREKQVEKISKILELYN